MLHNFIRDSARSIVIIAFVICDRFNALCAKVKELAEID